MNFTWPSNNSDKHSGGGFLEIDRNYGGVNYRIAICIFSQVFDGAARKLCHSDNNMEDVFFAFIGECCCIKFG